MKKRNLLILLLALAAALIPALGAARMLSYGSTGDDVTALQERLTALGYYTFRITGKYQERSQKAVSDFQAASGLPVTGKADDALQALLFSEEAAPKPTPTPAPTLSLKEAYPGKPLQYESSGANVRRIQTRLKELGYYQIEISGNFLKNTRSAVIAFQQQNGITADGIVGQETWNALFFADDAVDAAATPKPTPSPTPVPYRIGVDITNQVTTVYGLDDADGYTQIVKRMLCTTGTVKDPTPLGVFTLNGRTARWCYFDKWDTHAQYWTRITSSIAFHSVIYSEPNEMALATSTYRNLGKRGSHGCIRLLVDDARWIYKNCGKGTEVEIYEGASDPELPQSLKPAPLDTSVMLPQATPQPTEPPVYASDALPPMPFKTLSKGVESEAVYWLQCKLKELGYYNGTITGGYYGGTIEAVKAFQRDNGLSVDGKAGKETLTRLYADVLATPSPEPSPTAASTANVIATPLPTPTAKPSESPQNP
ncbi:MAG: peptidoglycan-binding protein [Clostridiales bacterium]|nr:peptidoglycan-binding protein [Clostridiales bacterium]